MSKWENFKKNIGKLADKTAKKTRELTDTAALKLKIANKEAFENAFDTEGYIINNGALIKEEISEKDDKELYEWFIQKVKNTFT